MVLELTIKNFRSINSEQKFTMLADKSVKEHSEYVSNKSGAKVLNSAVIYGRNASGKSNLLKAFHALQHLVLNSGEYKINEPLKNYEPYKLVKDTLKKPVEFAIDFIANDNIRYVYEIAYTRDYIEREKLSFYPKKQPARLFERYYKEPIVYGEYMTGRKKEIEDLLYDNQSFLSKAGIDRIEQLRAPFLFFSNYLFSSLTQNIDFDDTLVQLYTNRMARKHMPFFNENIERLLKAADTGIQSIEITRSNFSTDVLPEEMPNDYKNNIFKRYQYQIRTIHNIFHNGEIIGTSAFKLEDESTGTIKLLALGGVMLEALAEGQVLIIDELDKSLHPKLTRALVSIFNNSESNPKNAQLIFATHDVTLLDTDLFRRDQMWLCEKDFEGNSNYYSVSDVASVRKDTPIEKWYMDGRLGATPSINQNELRFTF